MKNPEKKFDLIFLFLVYVAGTLIRLLTRIHMDPHLLTFQADIWYRLCLAQFVLDNGYLPEWDIRYLAYGHVPFWYNPLPLYFLSFLSKLSHLDLPTVVSRIMPFVESFSIVSIYYLCRNIYNKRISIIATLFFLLSPSYLFWTGISTPQTFTIFLIPILILMWINFCRQDYYFNSKWPHLIAMGCALGINFMTHLSFFTHVIILIFVQLALVLEGKSKVKNYLYLFVPIAISQIISIWWWWPNNLYWWWTFALTTSSGLKEGLEYLIEYGITSAILGHIGFIFIIVHAINTRRKISAYYLVPVFWALFPLFESHNEGFLKLIGHLNLSWNNLCKPIEGFRFYVFLSQPLAICFALMLDKIFSQNYFKKIKKHISIQYLIFLLSLWLIFDMFYIYKIHHRFINTGMYMEEIRAAQWFKANSKPNDRILTEYYTAQMIGGICGGKALLGSMFPLKKVDFPCVKEKWNAQKDIYSVYLSQDIEQIKNVLERYNCTHVFLSNKVLVHIAYLTQVDSGIEDVKSIKREGLKNTLLNKKYFETVYQDKDVVILKWLN